MGGMDERPTWKQALPSVPHKLLIEPANIVTEFYKEHLCLDVDSGRLQPSDAWIVLRSFLVAAAQTHAAVCILLAENRPKPLMLQAGVLNRSLFEVFAAVLALTADPEPRIKMLMREFFKMLTLRHHSLTARFGQDPDWTEYLAVYREGLPTFGQLLDIPEELRKEPARIVDQWPTPGAMVYGRRDKPPFVSGTQLAVLKYFYESHYPLQSAQAHGRMAAVATAMLVDTPEAQWNPGHGESDLVTTALLLLVCILSEIEIAGSYAHHPKLCELWTYLRDMNGEARDVWNLRYAKRLSPG